MADDLYTADYYRWARDQASALRARGSGSNQLDYDNLAEEVEDLARRTRRACESQIENILEHLLKIEYLGGQNVRHWRAEVVGFRIELAKDMTPSLRASLPHEFARLYPDVRRRLAARLDAEFEGQAPTLPPDCPYDWDDVTGRGMDWTPEPAAA